MKKSEAGFSKMEGGPHCPELLLGSSVQGESLLRVGWVEQGSVGHAGDVCRRKLETESLKGPSRLLVSEALGL